MSLNAADKGGSELDLGEFETMTNNVDSALSNTEPDNKHILAKWTDAIV